MSLAICFFIVCFEVKYYAIKPDQWKNLLQGRLLMLKNQNMDKRCRFAGAGPIMENHYYKRISKRQIPVKLKYGEHENYSPAACGRQV
jgi:hypothetical protein